MEPDHNPKSLNPLFAESFSRRKIRRERERERERECAVPENGPEIAFTRGLSFLVSFLFFFLPAHRSGGCYPVQDSYSPLMNPLPAAPSKIRMLSPVYVHFLILLRFQCSPTYTHIHVFRVSHAHRHNPHPNLRVCSSGWKKCSGKCWAKTLTSEDFLRGSDSTRRTKSSSPSTWQPRFSMEVSSASTWRRSI